MKVKKEIGVNDDETSDKEEENVLHQAVEWFKSRNMMKIV